jgi:hypothetical protein
MDRAGNASKSNVENMNRLKVLSSISLLRIRVWETAVIGKGL